MYTWIDIFVALVTGFSLGVGLMALAHRSYIAAAVNLFFAVFNISMFAIRHFVI